MVFSRTSSAIFSMQPRLVDLIRNLGDDDRRACRPSCSPRSSTVRAHRDRAAAGRVGLEDALPADDEAAGREVGAGDRPAASSGELRSPRRRLAARWSITAMHAVDHLAHVVRRDVRRHADRDARRAVDQQVRERRRQDRRLFGGLVVVRNEVDGLLVEIRHHRFGDRFGTRLGVAHRRRRVAVDRAEVALAVDQGIAHVEVLRQADERVVDRRVAVRVIVAHHLADDLRALAIGAVRRQAHRAHAVEHAAVRRLQAVAHVGQRSPDDYAHRVIHVRALHLVFDVDGDFVRAMSVIELSMS